MSWTLAARAAKMNPSVIREILKLTEKPGVISFAGGLPAPRRARPPFSMQPHFTSHTHAERATAAHPHSSTSSPRCPCAATRRRRVRSGQRFGRCALTGSALRAHAPRHRPGTRDRARGRGDAPHVRPPGRPHHDGGHPRPTVQHLGEWKSDHGAVQETHQGLQLLSECIEDSV